MKVRNHVLAAFTLTNIALGSTPAEATTPSSKSTAFKDHHQFVQFQTTSFVALGISALALITISGMGQWKNIGQQIRRKVYHLHRKPTTHKRANFFFEAPHAEEVREQETKELLEHFRTREIASPTTKEQEGPHRPHLLAYLRFRTH